MKEKTKNSYEGGDMDKTQQWLDACDMINKSKLGVYLDNDLVKLPFFKDLLVQAIEKKETDDRIKFLKQEVLTHQIKVYTKLKQEEDGEQKSKDFLKKEGLTEQDLIDPVPIKLFGTDLRINQSTEEPKLLHNGAKVQSPIREIKIEADWIDQNWGNKKARLWLRLYRGEELIHDQDLFGICQRNDPNQKTREYGIDKEIVSKATAGDTYKIYGRSGGGGGHSLHVKKIEVIISALENNTIDPKVYKPDGNLME